MRINEVVPAKRLAESLVCTELSGKSAVVSIQRWGFQKGHSKQREPRMQRKKTQRCEIGGCFGVVEVCCARWGQQENQRRPQTGSDPAARGPGVASCLDGNEGHCRVMGWE